MTVTEVLSIRSDISLKITDQEEYVISNPQFSFTLKQLSPGLCAALSALFEGGKTQTQLLEIVANQDGWIAIPQFKYFLQHFCQEGMICRMLWADNCQLATVTPVTPAFISQAQPAQKTIRQDIRYGLSRFAFLHSEDGQVVLESPLACIKIILHFKPVSTLVTQLMKPLRYQELLESADNLAAATIKALLELLINAGLVTEVDDSGCSWETTDQNIAQWEFHDLLLHRRSRLKRYACGYGGTFRFVNTFNPSPTLKLPLSDIIIPLHRPDLTEISNRDPPLTTLLEQRKSFRVQGDCPISKIQLSEFLYRVARVRKLWQTEYGEVSDRPYPSGGAIYELEIYPVVNHCEGLDPGLYHYRPSEHELCQISGKTPPVEQLLNLASLMAMSEKQPQILIVLTARFPRLFWKYESIAYALILKHVGVLYQSMYLVATAMGLAPCALGGGDSNLFSQASGIDDFAEGAVGEFILGTRS